MVTGLSRSNNETLKEAFLKILEVPQTLPDGRTYSAAKLMKINEILRILKIPQHRIEDVATKPAPLPPPVAPAPPGMPAPSSSPAPASAPSAKPPKAAPEAAETDQDQI
jgi:hypothetical protein